MKILIDTNVILDWIMIRKPNAANAKKIMEQCLFGTIQGYITSHTITDIFYILRKDFSVEKRKQLLELLCEGLKVIPENSETILCTLRHKEWKDIEDGLQMQCAKEVNVDYIVTQNLKDFLTSEIKAVNEESFLRIIGSLSLSQPQNTP